MSTPLRAVCGNCGRENINPSFTGTATVPTANDDGECFYCRHKIFEQTQKWRVKQ